MSDDPIKLINLARLRRTTQNKFDKSLLLWNHQFYNNTTYNIKSIIFTFLTFIENIFTDLSLKINYHCYRWDIPYILEEIINVTEIKKSENNIEFGSEIQFLKSSFEYMVLVSGIPKYPNDERMIFRLWIPAYAHDKEICLLFILSGENILFTQEIGTILQYFLNIFILSINFAHYFAEKSEFITRLSHKKQDINLLNSCKNLLYHDLWKNFEDSQTNSIDIRKWLNDKPDDISSEKHQDTILSVYISTILYLLQQGNDELLSIIDKDHLQYLNDGIYIRLSRGPLIAIDKSMERSYCLALQAIIQYQNLNKRKQEKLYEIIRDSLFEDIDTNDDYLPKQTRQLKTLLTIIRQKVTKSKEPPDLRDILKKINQLSPYLAALINTALIKSDNEIELSSRWLEAWFGLRLLDSDPKILPNCDNLHLYEPQKIIEIIENWTLFYQYLIDYFILAQLVKKEDQDGFVDLPTEPENDKVKQAQLILLCEWAHAQGVPRSIPMQAWLMKTYQSELALYSLSPKGKHRQHIFHVQDTCLLGCVMLYSSWKPDGSTYLSKLATEAKIDENRLLCNWLVAALLHDIGYTLQILPRGLDSLPNGVIKGFDGLVNNINQMLSKQPESIDFDPTPNRTPFDLPISNHAYVSMITILSHMGALNDQWRTAYLYEPALSAIIEHDSMDTPVDYPVDPLSALLLICDQLQDWGRVRLNTTMFASKFVSNIRLSPGEEPEPISLSGMISSSRLYIKIKELDDNCNIIHHNDEETNSMQFLIHGPYANDGGYEPTIVWLDICRKLQKIREPLKNIANKLADETHGKESNPKDEPEALESCDRSLPIFSIALQHGLKEKERSELQRLIRFSNQDPEARGTILDWLSILRTKTEESIQYGFNDTLVREYHLNDKDIPEYEQYEWVKYTIPTLNNNDDRPIKNLPDGLYKSFRNFRDKEKLDS